MNAPQSNPPGQPGSQPNPPKITPLEPLDAVPAARESVQPAEPTPTPAPARVAGSATPAPRPAPEASSGPAPSSTPAPSKEAEDQPSSVPELDEKMIAQLSSTSMSPRHKVEAWIAVMVKSGASDLILRAGGRPSTRIDGRIGFLPGRVPAAGALLEVLEWVMGKDRMDAYRECGSVDSALHLDGLGRFRLNAYKQMGEPALVLRHVSNEAPVLEDLELPTAELVKIANRKRGLVLVTGIAGSGKSTTLAGLIQHMNVNLERHIVTLEDPIEILFSEQRCVISQREVGIDCPSFEEGLRHALRQSPDVILIGEMRDRATVSAALDAAETGHMVLSTMHTVNAAQSLDRILGFFPPEQHDQIRTRLSDNLAGVLSQRLIPRASGKGLVPSFELMTQTPRIRDLLEEGNTGEIARTIEQGATAGLISFNQSLRRLVQQKLVDLKDALAASDRPDELVLALRGITSGSGRRRGDGSSTTSGAAASPPAAQAWPSAARPEAASKPATGPVARPGTPPPAPLASPAPASRGPVGKAPPKPPGNEGSGGLRMAGGE